MTISVCRRQIKESVCKEQTVQNTDPKDIKITYFLF